MSVSVGPGTQGTPPASPACHLRACAVSPSFPRAWPLQPLPSWPHTSWGQHPHGQDAVLQAPTTAGEGRAGGYSAPRVTPHPHRHFLPLLPPGPFGNSAGQRGPLPAPSALLQAVHGEGWAAGLCGGWGDTDAADKVQPHSIPRLGGISPGPPHPPRPVVVQALPVGDCARGQERPWVSAARVSAWPPWAPSSGEMVGGHDPGQG